MRREILRYLGPILAFLLCCQSIGQQHYKFESLIIDGHASQIECTSILQDQQGFLWLGSRDGLFKYDGYQLDSYRPNMQQKNTISHNYITALEDDATGYIWIGTMNGLNRYDPQTQGFKHYARMLQRKDGSGSHPINSLYAESPEILWIGTSNGFYMLDVVAATVEEFLHDPDDSESISNNDVTFILEDSFGLLWVGTNGGLNVFDRETRKFTCYRSDPNDPKSISHNYIRTMYEDRGGILWVGTYSGLNKFDRQTGSFVNYTHDTKDPSSISNNYVRRIYEDREGVFWVGTWGGGLNNFDRKTGRFYRYESNPYDPFSINHNDVNEIMEDSSGVLWVATDLGPNKLDKGKNQFVHYRHIEGEPESLSGNNVIAVMKDQANALWVSSSGNGLSRRRPGSDAFDYFSYATGNNPGLTNNTVTSLFQGNNNEVWIGTNGGGIEFFNTSTQNFDVWNYSPGDSSGMSSRRIMVMIEDQAGNIWSGFPIEGLCKIDKRTGESRHFDTRRATIWCIFESSDGVIWIGTSNDGLYAFDPKEDHLTHYQQDSDDHNSLSDNGVTAIVEDRSGNLWIGTKDGINRFDPKTQEFFRIPIEGGLPTNEINGIVQDANMHLWFTSSAGIARYNPSTGKTKTYDVRDGLQGNVFNRGASFVDDDGWIYLGGANGLNKFHPDSIKQNKFVPPVQLTNFRLFTKTVPVGSPDQSVGFVLPYPISKMEELNLSYKENVFSFEFAALHYSAPGKNKYAFKLEGFDQDWIQTDASRRFASYSNLDAGTYTFKVKGSNKDGVWNDKPASIKIIITPAPWRSWWANIIYLLILIGAVLGIFYWRTAALSRRKRELAIEVRKKTKALEDAQDQLIHQEKMASLGLLIAGIGHKINNPLNFINQSVLALSMKLKRGIIDPLKDDIKEFDGINEGIKRIANIINSLRRFSRDSGVMNEHCNLVEIIDGCLEILQAKIKGAEISVSKSYPDKTTLVAGNEGKLHQAFLNFISNALDASVKGGTLSISAELHEEQFKVRIRDTGAGMGPKTLKRLGDPFFTTKEPGKGTGLGIYISKDIIEAHKGTVSYKSKLGEGTTAFVTLPELK